MGADKWSVCPRCMDQAIIKHNADMAAVTSAYGKIPVEEFDRRRDLLVAPVPSDYVTFREDWEIYGAEEGTVKVSYRGQCSKCKLSLSFAEDHEIPDAPA